MELFQNEVNQIVQTTITPGETVQLAGYGWDRSTQASGVGKAALRYLITKSTTGDYKSYDYLVVAKTDQRVYFIPAKIKGTFSIRLVPNPERAVESYTRAEIQPEIGATDASGGIFSRPSIDIKFRLPNQAEKNVQFYDDIGKWQQF